jgi:anti-anti-sigma regulatory factor
MPRLTLSVTYRGLTLVTLDGVVDNAHARSLRAVMGWDLDRVEHAEALCLEDLDALDAPATQLLAAALLAFRSRGTSVQLVFPTADLLRRLARAGLLGRFTISTPDEETALISGDAVEVFSPFDRSWLSGFQLDREGRSADDGAMTRTVRRTSDRSVLPHAFRAVDVRRLCSGSPRVSRSNLLVFGN